MKRSDALGKAGSNVEQAQFELRLSKLLDEARDVGRAAGRAALEAGEDLDASAPVPEPLVLLAALRNSLSPASSWSPVSSWRSIRRPDKHPESHSARQAHKHPEFQTDVTVAGGAVVVTGVLPGTARLPVGSVDISGDVRGLTSDEALELADALLMIVMRMDTMAEERYQATPTDSSAEAQ